jgi:arylsulfatase A-like enzyme
MSRLVNLLLFVVFSLLSQLQAAETRPNILFIITDDQCFESLGTINNPEVQTPNLDALARSGTRFTHAYNMGSWSGAVCVASRTMLNSGRFVWDAEKIWKSSEQERKAGRWWSEHMKAAGYRTYMTGKWHCEAKPEKAFDVVRDVRPGMPNQTDAGYNRPLSPENDSWSPTDPKFEGFWKGGTHWSEIVANHSKDFLDEAKSHDAPFFMYVAFNAPHDPRQSPQEFLDRYPLGKVAVPENFLAQYPHAKAMGCGPDIRDEMLAPFPRTPFAIKTHRREYYALITHLDQMIGRVIEALKASGKADNTWIFLTSDHGLACGQHGLMGKQNLYDHSVRVPFLVAGPGVDAGREIDGPIYLQDVMPTTLELAGVDRPDHVQFHSLLPMLAGGESPYPSIYGAYLKLQRSIRNDRHKLIVYPEAKVMRLYDLQVDPREMNDLASQESSKPILREMFADLQKLQAEMGDSVDLSAIAIP